MTRLAGFAAPHKGGYIKSVILAVLGVACGLVPFFLFARVIIALIDGNTDISFYLKYCAVSAGFYILKRVFAALSTSASHAATFKVMSEVRHKIADKLTRVPMGFILESPSGKFQNSIVDRVEQIEVPLAHAVPEVTSNLLVPLGIIVYLFVLDWRMALASLVTLPFVMLSYSLMMKEYPKKYGEVVQAGKHMSGTIVEYINGIEVIKTFNQSASSYEKFSNAVKRNADIVLEWMESTLWYSASMMSLMPAVLIGVLPVGLLLFGNGLIELPVLITSLLLSLGIMAPLGAAVFLIEDISKVATIMNDLGWILDAPEMDRPENRVELPNLDIELDNLGFAYGQEMVLSGVNLSIAEGSVTALVGPSGSGKSTITKLIAGLWDPAEGAVRIGGTNLGDIPFDQASDLVSYVSQDNYLFNESIRENIRMARPEASDNDVEAVAIAAGCHDFIQGLEHGYDTIAGGSGGHLSGGERQRIAIARAMMKNAPIVILDEATSYTDPENEAVIQEAVGRMVAGKTLIVIAHRLSTITDADTIALVEGGRISASGTHNELLSESRQYARMWEAHTSVKDTTEEVTSDVQGV
ncbi:MAG: ABC transporter ATP-binding protein [Spirochaetales bacterium]|nr:ABC transporter ATP-binding protein [Spirochaetales bacterium]